MPGRRCLICEKPIFGEPEKVCTCKHPYLEPENRSTSSTQELLLEAERLWRVSVELMEGPSLVAETKPGEPRRPWMMRVIGLN